MMFILERLSKVPFCSFLLSLFFHTFVFLLLYGGLVHFRSSVLLPPPPKSPTEALPEVVLDLSPPVSEKRSAIQTASEHPLEEAPKDAAFESHENTEAASELPAAGTAPLPTQEGEESDFLELKKADSTDRAKSLSSPAEEGEKNNSTNTVPPTTLPAPTSLAPAAKEEPVMGTLSAKARGENVDSHPSMIRGAISNKGKSSVAAEATPIGRYKKILADAISAHWYHSIDQRMELLSFGTATIFFYVNQDGKIEELHIISNSSNQTFANCCIQSITEAKIPAIPPEIARTLDKGRLEIEYRFTIYPN